MKKYGLKLIVFCSTLLFLTSVSFAEEAAVLISSKGSVLISENGKDDWVKAGSGISIQEGWYIKVGKNSEAALMLKDRSQIRLKDNSIICLKKSGSAPGEKKQKKGLLSLFKGGFWMRNKRKVIKPDINTASINMSIRGTELKVIVTPEGETRVTALEGEILCENKFSSTVITRGIEAVAREGEAIETHKLINPDNSVQWLLVTLNIAGPKDKFPATSKQMQSVALSKNSMDLLVVNQMEKAYEKALDAINISPDTASANIAMATILQVQGKLEGALIFAKKGLQTDPESEPALLRNIELLLGLNQTQDAENLLDSFKGEKTAVSYMLKGYILLLKHELLLAEEAFNTAISMEKEISRAWVGLGLALYSQGKIDQGLDKLEIASLLNPLSAFPHNNLGKALYEAKEYEQAENEFIRASLLDPNDPTPYLYLSIMAQDNFEPAKSIKQLKKALAMNDNRFVSRSRFLLDMDRSVKNINLAAGMSALGLNEWGRHIGNKAVWEDNANSSAYMFRASEALSLQRIDVATLSDLKRAELLKPVNSNTFPSFTDYYSLLELPEHNQTLEVYGGTDETFGSTLTLQGGKKQQSYLASAHFDVTDGPFTQTGSSSGYLDLKYKIEPLFNHQFSLGILGGKGNHEDLRPLQNGFAKANTDDTDYDFFNFSTGYHWTVSSQQDLLVSIQYQDRDSGILRNRLFTPSWGSQFNWQNSFFQDDKRYRAEVIDLIKFKNHKLTLGGILGVRDRNIEDFQIFQSLFPTNTVLSQNVHQDPEETEIKVFAKDLWAISDNMILDLGFEWCRFDADGKNDISRWLPQVGAVWGLKGNNLVRAAYFREIQPDYLSSTLQPVEVAGFSSITGVPSGTLTEFYGIAFERQWATRYFTSLDIQMKKKDYNSNYLPHPNLSGSWLKEESKSLGFALEYLFSDQYAVSFTQRFKKIEPEITGFDRRDSETGVRFTCVYPFGLTIQTAWWFVDQKFDTTASGINGDNFIIGSISARQSIYNKKMELFFNIDNILDKKFNYVPEEPTEALQLPWQGIFFMAGFRIKF